MKQIETCACCEGIESITPESTANRPGLTALSYRVGTHATFLETMLARLSSADFPKLAELRTRESDDPAIALLDAWAVVADVLTFYNERIINEAYLRTATERRSVLELGRLVGYKLRPGVASSVYLAYTLDANAKEEVVIPKGARSQSIPGPGELPQSFESSEDLKARVQWNNLRPRQTQPQTINSINAGIKLEDGIYKRLYLKGVNTNLKANDPLLIALGNNTPEFFRIKEIKPEPTANRTLVVLQDVAPSSIGQQTEIKPGLIEALTLAPSVQLANGLHLQRNLSALFVGNVVKDEKLSATANAPTLSYMAATQPANSKNSELYKTLASGEASHLTLKTLAPMLKDTLSTATTNAKVTDDSTIKVYALRVKASPFGHNAPLRPVMLNPQTHVMEYSEWSIDNPGNISKPSAMFTATPNTGSSPLNVVFANQSTGQIYKVEWRIDGSFESGTWNLTKQFNTAKTYTVMLTVYGLGGIDSRSVNITVEPPPVVIN